MTDSTATKSTFTPQTADASSNAEITLERRRIYILPTRHGYLFAVTLFLMLLGAINYNNSMAFALTFLLAGLGINGMWSTHRNLLGLRIGKGFAPPTFAGRELRFGLNVRNPSTLSRHGVSVEWPGGPRTDFAVGGNALIRVEARFASTQRGRAHPGRLRIETRYPLGLFCAWSWLELDMSGLVYPKPLIVDMQRTSEEDDRGADPRDSSDDYSGLRDYQPSDSPKHIAWKAWARIDELLTKEFRDTTSAAEVWLDWDTLNADDGELRLSILCDWVLKATRMDLRYGLRLPDATITPASGEAHKRICLEALALCEIPA